MEKTVPTILVIFGITGDLAHRKLMPALAEIKKAGQLPKDFKILGISRRAISKTDVLTEECSDLEPLLDVRTMDLDQPGDYEALKQRLGAYETGQVIFYFAVPPAAVLPMVKNLGACGLNGKYAKLLLEKPFGVDYASAKSLIDEINAHFSEDQIFRIDHYLAKEMAQNITVFLGSNTVFRDLWSNQFIESVEIAALEDIGIEGRTNFYEQTGILRDWVQSHLLQLAALVLMEPCSDIFDFEEIPKRRLAALKMIKAADPQSAIRGQYDGYRQEVANPVSVMETFVHLILGSSDPRWHGVPIKLVAGKKMDRKLSQITVNFKKVADSSANSLVFRIQPDEAIEIDLWVKKPGYERELQKLKLDFKYDSDTRLPDAYEMVMVDAMRSNHSLFASSAEVLASWKILQSLLDAWHEDGDDLIIYRPGSTIEQITDDPAA